MEIEELEVVAVMAPTPGVEVIADNAIARSSDGCRFALSHRDADGFVPHSVIYEEEFQRLLDAGVFHALPRWSAVRGYVVGLVSTNARVLIDELRVPMPAFASAPLAYWGFAWYLPDSAFRSLRTSVAAKLAEGIQGELVRWEAGVANALVSLGTRARVAAGFALDGSPEQLRIATLSVLYAEAIGRDSDTARGAALARLPRAIPDFDARLDALRAEVERAAKSLPEARHPSLRVVARGYDLTRAA